MARFSFGTRTMAVLLALLAAPATTFAQSAAATREGNVWGWRDHQPTEAEISRKEKATGIAPGPSQRDDDAATVDDLYQQLMDRVEER